jgi:hypothetical protein
MPAATVTFKLENAHTEGSYYALTSIYGQEFSIHYVAGEIRVYGTGGQRGRKSWQVDSAAKAVKAAVASRIAALGPDFAAKHAELYAEELAA